MIGEISFKIKLYDLKGELDTRDLKQVSAQVTSINRNDFRSIEHFTALARFKPKPTGGYNKWHTF